MRAFEYRDVLWTKTPIELSPYHPSFGGLEKESLLTLHSESDAGNEVSRNDRVEASTSVQDYRSISTRRAHSPCGSQWSWVHPYSWHSQLSILSSFYASENN